MDLRIEEFLLSHLHSPDSPGFPLLRFLPSLSLIPLEILLPHRLEAAFKELPRPPGFPLLRFLIITFLLYVASSGSERKRTIVPWPLPPFVTPFLILADRRPIHLCTPSVTPVVRGLVADLLAELPPLSLPFAVCRPPFPFRMSDGRTIAPPLPDLGSASSYKVFFLLEPSYPASLASPPPE